MNHLIDSSVASQFDRLPPHSTEAEMCLLASMMLDKEIAGQIAPIVDRDAFFQADHQVIFDVLLKLYEQNRPVDAVILRDELGKRQLLDEIGGVDYLARILESVPSAAHGTHYAGIVREKALLRQLIAASNEILRDAYAPHEKAELIVDRAEKRIFEIAQRKIGAAVVPMEQVLHEVFEMLENRTQRGLGTGFYDLDDMLNGLQPGEMIIVAARPSMGKCLVADSEIVLSDGSVTTIEQVVKRRSATLLTLGDDLRLGWTAPSAFVDDGIKPTFRVTTRLGRTVESTLTHPFLTVAGWRRLEELKPGDHIAVPRRIDAFGTRDMPECRVKLLAYARSAEDLANAGPLIHEDFAEAMSAANGPDTRSETETGGADALVGNRPAGARVPCPAKLLSTKHRHPEPVTCLWHTHDRRKQVVPVPSPAFGPQGRVCTKQVPSPLGLRQSLPFAEVFPGGRPVAASPPFSEQPARDLGVGLGHLDTEIPHFVRDDAATPAGVAEDRHDATARFVPRAYCRRGRPHPSMPGEAFTLPRASLALFLNRLFALHGWASVLARGESLIGFAAFDARFSRQLQHLLLRFGVIARVQHGADGWVVEIRDPASVEAFAMEIGIYGGENAVETARRAAAAGTGAAASAPTSDVYWDEIVSIEHTGEKQVYDLTIPGTHNFVANDVCVHNTAFAMNLVEAIAAEQMLPVAVFSLEMSKQQLAQRMLCSRGEIDSHKLRRGLLTSQEYTKLATVVGQLAKAPIWVDDSAGLTPLDLRAKARRLKLQHDIRCVMIDYMQLMDNPGPESRQQQISEISRGVKAVARELSVPVICLSQLNRASEGRDGHRPRMSDLRESGSIEQDADVVMLLHREDYYRMAEPDFVPDNIAEIIVAKQRNGPTGTVKLAYLRQSTRFANLTEQDSPFG